MPKVHLLAAYLEWSTSWGLVLVFSSATLDRKRVWQGRERESVCVCVGMRVEKMQPSR